MKKITLLIAFLSILSWQANAQFTEDFEGAVLPTGWAIVLGDNGTSPNDITFPTGTNHTSGGSYSAQFSSFSSSSDYNQYLFTHQFTVTAPNTELRFWHQKSNGGVEVLEWGVSTTTQDTSAVSSWTPVILSQGVWVEEVVDLSAYIGQTIYFSFHYYGNYQYFVFLDDVSLSSPPSCPDPSALTTTNITTTSADLGWTENGTATTWDIEWDTTGFVQGTGTMVTGTTTNPHNITGLTASTAYDFYVRADCGGSLTSTWISHTFTTPCNVLAVPFLEDFETTSSSLGCWSQIQEVGAGDWTFATGSSGGSITTAFSGTQNARFVSMSGANSPVTKLVSPTIDLTTLTSPELSFYYGQEDWSGDQNTLKVYYRISSSDPWVQIANDTTNVTAWTQQILTLPNPSATYQIAFEGINNWGRANVVDDVDIHEAPTCIAPSILTATNITATSADLGWTENGSATSWEIEWDTTGFAQGAGTSVITTTNPHNLTGLTSTTSYDYYVRAVCGSGDSSVWVGPFTFSTLCNVFTAPFTESFDINTTPACWSQSATTGGPWEFGQLGAADYASTIFDDHTANGGYFAWMDFSGGGNDVGVILELPDVDISALTSPTLSFWMASFNTDDNDSNILFIDAWDGAMWVLVDSLQQDDSTWVQHSYNISGFTYGANLTRFRFRAEMDPVGVDFFYNDLLIDDINIDVTTGIKLSLSNVNLNVYPNPTSGLFTLNVNTTDVNELDIKVMNVQGQVVYAKNNFTNIANINEQIDLSSNAKGIYFVNVTSDKGVVTHKIIVQ